MVIEFPAIVSLKGKKRKTELGLNIGVEDHQTVKNIRFCTQWEGPNVMSVIINQYQVVFESRKARNR